jgi:hypothetical protein
MDAVVAKYTQDGAQNALEVIYQSYIDKRIALLQGAIVPAEPTVAAE